MFVADQDGISTCCYCRDGHGRCRYELEPTDRTFEGPSSIIMAMIGSREC